MDQVRALRGQVVALDTAPLIYFIEEHPKYVQRVDPFFEAMDRGGVHDMTASITIVEVLVHPYRHGDLALVQRYRDIMLNVRGLQTVPLTPVVAKEAAKLRASYNLAPPDAIQLATALTEGATTFLTNDRRLPQLPLLTMLLVDNL